jgi:serine/threonine protein kinase
METRTLGDYTLIKQVGQGSLGAVYLAEHRFMKQQYILKVLPEELASDRGFIQRFEEDVANLASLEHPHIVKIHTVSFAQGQYFLVTDCVVDEFGETTNLAQYMLSRGKRFDEETLFRLLRQVAEALDYAHSKKINGKGIVHRNLKLNNILVAKGRGGIDLAISDFGLARIIGNGAVLTRTYKTVAEALGIGSLLYQSKTGQEKYPNPPVEAQKLIPLHASFLQNYAFLAPEQRRLDYPYPIDAKVDVYAFGVLVYYLLMSEFPEGLFEMPSVLFPDSSWNWDPLISACLQSNPEKRPESLVTVLDAVRQQAKGLMGRPAPAIKNSMEEAPAPADPAKQMGNTIAQEIAGKLFQSNSSLQSALEIETEKVEQKAEIIKAPSEAATATALLKPILKTAEIERPSTDPDPAAVFLIDTTVKQYTPERREVKKWS